MNSTNDTAGREIAIRQAAQIIESGDEAWTLPLALEELERVKQALEARDAFARRVERQYSSVKQERDELLAALKHVQSKLGEYEGKGDRRQGELIIIAWEAARDAIAKAEKGGAQ